VGTSSEQQESQESAEQARGATETYADLPAGLTADMFNLYVSVDADVQTAADSSDAELLASVTTAQSAGDESPSDDDSTSDNADVTHDSTPVVTLATALHSLDNLRAYLESDGCDSYENFYKLVDQVYGISKQRTVQKTIKDFFANK